MLLKLTELKKLEGNPRTIKKEDIDKLTKSIEKFGVIEGRPFLVSNRTGENVIIGGNQRYEVCKKLGIKEVPVHIMEGLTEEEEREIIIRDNISNGDWDWDILANEWDKEELTEWGLDVPFVEEVPEAEEDDFEVDEGIKTDIVLGDLFEIGQHRLLCGDSTNIDDVNKLMNGEMADMMITDPPYNVALGMETKEQAKARNRRTDGLTIQNDKMSNEDFYQFLYDFYTATSTVTKKGGAIYVWYTSSEVVNFVKSMVDAGWLYKQELIWNKTSLIMGRQDYQWKHEPCLYGWLDGDSHEWNSDRTQTTIIDFEKPTKSGEHPTMKPVGLFAYQIGNSSKKGEIVLDAFGGSGTTMVACEQLGRKARVVEFDPKYVQTIINRMMKLDSTLEIKRNGQPYLIG